MFLGIDQGTTGTTAVLLGETGEIIAKATADVPQHFPRPGLVEHDPEEIWASVREAVVRVREKTKRSAREIKAIGITNQRETVSLFDASSKPLHRFIVWQDRRTSDYCEKLKKKHEKRIRTLSGLPLDPYFSASKIHWLLDRLKMSKKPNPGFRFRTIDSFLLERMTGADAIEATNASRTALMNLKKVAWSDELLDVFKIPKSLCPPIIPSEGFDFKTRALDFLPNGIPVRAILGDQQAALFGQCGWTKGSGKITYGTGSFVLLNTGNEVVNSKSNLVSTLALQFANKKKLYALEGSAFICGAWIQWLRDQLKIISSADESEAKALEVLDSEGVVIIPALAGMGAPFWKPEMRGAILGLTRGVGASHIVRASLEALAFQNRALIDAFRNDLKSTKLSWKVDGGAVKNNLLLQIQANVFRAPILRPSNLEATSVGVALLSAYSAKQLSLDDISKLWQLDKKFEPDMTQNLYQKSYDRWFQIVVSLRLER